MKHSIGCVQSASVCMSQSMYAHVHMYADVYMIIDLMLDFNANNPTNSTSPTKYMYIYTAFKWYVQYLCRQHLNKRLLFGVPSLNWIWIFPLHSTVQEAPNTLLHILICKVFSGLHVGKEWTILLDLNRYCSLRDTVPPCTNRKLIFIGSMPYGRHCINKPQCIQSAFTNWLHQEGCKWSKSLGEPELPLWK
jgi:hypothetical protein